VWFFKEPSLLRFFREPQMVPLWHRSEEPYLVLTGTLIFKSVSKPIFNWEMFLLAEMEVYPRTENRSIQDSLSVGVPPPCHNGIRSSPPSSDRGHPWIESLGFQLAPSPVGVLSIEILNPSLNWESVVPIIFPLAPTLGCLQIWRVKSVV
jgi:hypothetical protein